MTACVWTRNDHDHYLDGGRGRNRAVRRHYIPHVDDSNPL